MISVNTSKAKFGACQEECGPKIIFFFPLSYGWLVAFFLVLPPPSTFIIYLYLSIYLSIIYVSNIYLSSMCHLAMYISMYVCMYLSSMHLPIIYPPFRRFFLSSSSNSFHYFSLFNLFDCSQRDSSREQGSYSPVQGLNLAASLPGARG